MDQCKNRSDPENGSFISKILYNFRDDEIKGVYQWYEAQNKLVFPLLNDVAGLPRGRSLFSFS